ncbi:MAG TPA: lysoplasmalogenase [Cyclobacteriaceae bacterium]|nr:lysoplasmalogenase [Cyclobacteriaceae bacterium]
MKKIFLYLFLLVSAGVLLADAGNAVLLHTVCKPAIMIALGLHYWMMQREQGVISKPVVLAIIFSCAGDTLLMFQGRDGNFFMWGLAAFLVAHIFYILAYRQHQSADTSNELQGLQKIRYAFPVILSGTGLVVILYGRLGGMKIPVLVYAMVITVMVLAALFRFGKTSSPSFAMVFGGAILFMISDSLIAINKFLEPLPMAGFWIMTTYIAAQYLIVTGLLKHKY